ncbi:MAG: cation:proton antiporter [Gammaproteobacteria bacterium]|jgi:Kef-type K+ transport system membrane component KefB
MASEYPLLIVLGLLLVVSPLVKSVLGRVGVPAVVGHIAIGFLVVVLNQPLQFATPAFENTFWVLGQLGLVALLFRVGLKSHVQQLLAKLPDASLVWAGDVLTNLALGFVVSHYALALPLETSLVIAVAFSATSVAVSVAVWQDAGKLNTARGQLLVDVAELDDLSGVLLLAILLTLIPLLLTGAEGLLATATLTTLAMLAKLALFVAGCYLFSRYIEARFTRFNRALEGTMGMTITILGASLAIASVAGYLGFSLAIGALFAGLAFSRDPQAVRSDARFENFYELFTPFFFIHIGMQVDPAAIPLALGLAGVFLVVAALGKFIGVGVPTLLLMSKADAATLGVSMVPRAEIALVVADQCRRLGEAVVSHEVFAAMVLISVATSIFAPLMLRRMLRE